MQWIVWLTSCWHLFSSTGCLAFLTLFFSSVTVGFVKSFVQAGIVCLDVGIFIPQSKSQLMWDISYRWKSSIFRSTIAKGILHPLEKIPGSTECQAPTTGILTMRVCIHFSTFPNSSLSLSPALCLQVLASGTIFGQTQAKKQKSLNPSKSLSSIFYPILFCISLLLPWYKSSQ